MAKANERVLFSDGDRLDLNDLRVEQAYHLETTRTHLVAAHSWGIQDGLTLAPDGEGEMVVAPGMAVDGYGRVLLLDRPIPIPAQAFIDRDATALDVFLVFSLVRERSGRPDACGRIVADRAVERPFLRLDLADPSRLPRWLPPDLPPRDLDVSAERQAPQAQQAWPVFLGRARFDPEGDPPLSADPTGRRYGGVRAERVEAPSGAATLALGRQEDGVAHLTWQADTVDGPRTLLDIGADGAAMLAADLSVGGDVVLEQGALAFQGVAPAGAPQPPASMALYSGTSEQGLETTDLRIALPDAELGATARFVVGAWSEEANSFKDILVVEEDGTVTIAGTLSQLPPNVSPLQPKAQAQFDAATQQLIQAAMFNAIGGTGSAIIDAIVNGGDGGRLGQNLGLSGFVLGEFIANALPADQVADFAERLEATNAGLRSALADALATADAGGGGGGGG